MRTKNTEHFLEVDGAKYYTTLGLMAALKLRKSSFWKEVRSGRIMVAMKHPIGNLYSLDTPAKWKSEASGIHVN